MLQIRHGVFETNSSSTHSITIVPKDEFEKWVDGEVYFNDDSWEVKNHNKWLTKEEAIVGVLGCDYPPTKDDDYHSYTYKELNEMSNKDLSEILYKYSIYSFNKYSENYGLEYYDVKYITEHGDEIVAFGLYGMDG